MAWLLQQMHLMFAFDNTNRLTLGWEKGWSIIILALLTIFHFWF